MELKQTEATLGSMEAPQSANQADDSTTPFWQLPMRLVKRNWRAALTVSLVNIPLSISLAIASGGTPVQAWIRIFPYS